MNYQFPLDQYSDHQAQMAVAPIFNSGAYSLQANWLNYSIFARSLFEENQKLNKDAENLRKALDQTQNARRLQGTSNQIEINEREPEYRPEGDKPRKVFSKDKKCPMEGCERLYSSKIAVRSHIRRHHLRNKTDSPW